MLLVKAVRKEKAPNPGDCHGIGASLWDMPLYIIRYHIPSVISYLPASALPESSSMGIISADSLSIPVIFCLQM